MSKRFIILSLILFLFIGVQSSHAGQCIVESNTFEVDTGPTTLSIDGQLSHAGSGAVESNTFEVDTEATTLVSSSTHPDPTLWYQNNHPVFTWTPSLSVSGYYTIFDQQEDTVPTASTRRQEDKSKIYNELTTGDFVIDTEIDYPNTSEGTWYFHIVAKLESGVMDSVAAQMRVNIDSSPPVISSKTHPNSQEWSNVSNVQLSWNVPHPESVARYYYLIDENADTIPTTESGKETWETTLKLLNVADGKHYLHVVWEDRAGNIGTKAGHYGFWIDTTPPQPVTDLRLEKDGSDIILTWTEPEDTASGVAYYQVFRSDREGVIGSNLVQDGEVVDEALSRPVKLYVDSGAEDDEVDYFYTIFPVDKANNVQRLGNANANNLEAHTVTVTAEPSSIVANGVSSSIITITVRSKGGRLVTSETVSLIADLGVIPIEATNNYDGTYTAEYRSATVPGKAFIVANTSNGKMGAIEIELTARKVSSENSSISATSNIIADGKSYSEIRITVLDEQNMPMSWSTITQSWNATTESLRINIEVVDERGVVQSGENNTIIQPGPTNIDGVTIAKLASTKAGVKTITAKLKFNDKSAARSIAIGQTTAKFVPDQPAVVDVQSEHAQLVADGKATSLITATVKDAHENLISDQVVTLITEFGSVQTPPTSNGDGTYTSVYTAPTKSGTAIIQASVPNGKFGTVEIELLEHRADAGQSKINAGGVYPADGKTPVPVTVILYDDKEQPVAGKIVEILIEPVDGVSIAQLTTLTDLDGKITATFTSTKAGVKTVSAIDASDDVKIEENASVIFTHGEAANVEISAQKSTLVVVDASLYRPDGSSSTQITITVTDQFGNPVKNEEISISQPAAGSTNQPAAGLTDPINNGDGTYSSIYTASTEEGKVILVATTSNGKKGKIELTLVAKDTIAEIQSVNVVIDRDGEVVPVAKFGDVISISMIGEPKGTALFAIDGVVDDVPMSENVDGKYVGKYTVNDGDDVAGTAITVTLRDAKGNISYDRSKSVTIDTIRPPAPQDLIVVDSSINASNVTNVQIKGKATPGVSLTVTLSDNINPPIEKKIIADINSMFIVFVDASALQDGEIEVTAVEADDLAGNHGEVTKIEVAKDAMQKFPPSFQLTAKPGYRSVRRGGTVTYHLSIVGTYGFDKEIELKATDLPTDVTPSFEPQKVTPTKSASLSESVLTLIISDNAPIGRHNFTIIATNEGKYQKIDLTLEIFDVKVPIAEHVTDSLVDNEQALSDEIIYEKDGARMRLILAGEFEMGGKDRKYSDERPVHTVYLDDFYIDVYEVTNAMYANFLNAVGKHRGDDGTVWLDIDNEYALIELVEGQYRPKPGFENYPVIEVSWYGAAAYAQWAGKRLPTEAEWEKAARGGLSRKRYPWGDKISHNYANYSGTFGRDRWKGIAPVGNFLPNGYSLYDMAGNVWEWCMDEYDSGFYAKSPKKNPVAGELITFVNNDFMSIGTNRVLRGGGWDFTPTYLRVACRGNYTPSFMHYYVGFRCAKSVK